MPGSSESETERSFDEILRELREVVGKLESGKLSLDQSLSAYEHGIALARAGHDTLDRAEKRVELLIKPPSDDEPEQTEPLDED